MLANSSGLPARPYYPHSSHFSPSSRCKLSLSPNCSCFVNSTKSSKFISLSLLLSAKNYPRKFSVKALAQEPRVSESETVATDAPPSFPQPVSVKIPYGDRHVWPLLIFIYFFMILCCVLLGIAMPLCYINSFLFRCCDFL